MSEHSQSLHRLKLIAMITAERAVPRAFSTDRRGEALRPYVFLRRESLTTQTGDPAQLDSLASQLSDQ